MVGNALRLTRFHVPGLETAQRYLLSAWCPRPALSEAEGFREQFCELTWAGWPVRVLVSDANLGSGRFSPAEGKLLKPYTRRYFSPVLFLLSTITLRRIWLIRVW